MSTKKLRKWSLWILICTVFVLFGCGSQLNTPSDVILDTNSPSNPASNENQKDSDIYEEYSKLERAYMEKHYNGVMPSLVSLHSILNRIVDANLPLTKFSALILDIERSKDGLEYTLKIDKVELNDKFVDSALNEEPQYYNKEVKIEETTIPYDTVFVITNFISVSIDENLIDYIHNSVDDEGNSTYIYDFYLCGDEVVFIHNIDMV